MKFKLTLAACLLAALSQAQVRMLLSVNGQPMGDATLQQKLDSSGRLTQSIRSTIEMGGVKARVDHDSLCDKTGRPISERSFRSAGPRSETLVTEYGSKSVKVTHTEAGKSASRTVAIPKGNLTNPSTLWFISVRPKAGTGVSYLHLDETSMTWKTETSTYVGDGFVPGLKVKCHHIRHDNGEEWVDDKGYPVRVEFEESGTKMVLTRK